MARLLQQRHPLVHLLLLLVLASAAIFLGAVHVESYPAEEEAEVSVSANLFQEGKSYSPYRPEEEQASYVYASSYYPEEEELEDEEHMSVHHSASFYKKPYSPGYDNKPYMYKPYGYKPQQQPAYYKPKPTYKPAPSYFEKPTYKPTPYFKRPAVYDNKPKPKRTSYKPKPYFQKPTYKSPPPSPAY